MTTQQTEPMSFDDFWRTHYTETAPFKSQCEVIYNYLVEHYELKLKKKDEEISRFVNEYPTLHERAVRSVHEQQEIEPLKKRIEQLQSELDVERNKVKEYENYFFKLNDLLAVFVTKLEKMSLETKQELSELENNARAELEKFRIKEEVLMVLIDALEKSASEFNQEVARALRQYLKALEKV